MQDEWHGYIEDNEAVFRSAFRPCQCTRLNGPRVFACAPGTPPAGDTRVIGLCREKKALLLAQQGQSLPCGAAESTRVGRDDTTLPPTGEPITKSGGDAQTAAPVTDFPVQSAELALQTTTKV